MMTLQSILLLSSGLFAVGLAAALVRRNAILILVGIELMIAAANLNFLAFWRFGPNPGALTGVLFALFGIAVAAGGVAVGLALILLVYRHFKTIDLRKIPDKSSLPK